MNNKKMKLIPCEYWEDISIAKQERKRSINNVLESMAEHLRDIALMLKEDLIDEN